MGELLAAKTLKFRFRFLAFQTKLNSDSRCSSSSSINSIPADANPATLSAKHSSISSTNNNNNTINNNEHDSISNNISKGHVNGSNNNDENNVIVSRD